MDRKNALLDSAVIACANFVVHNRHSRISPEGFPDEEYFAFCETIKDETVRDFLLKSFKLALDGQYTGCIEVMAEVYYEEIDKSKLTRSVLQTLLVIKLLIVPVLYISDFKYFFDITQKMCGLKTLKQMCNICRVQYLERYSELYPEMLRIVDHNETVKENKDEDEYK